MSRLLYITYVFPPTGGAGIQRNVKFIKFLSRLGWEIIVMTPRNPSVPTTDNSFSRDIPSDVEVVYTRTLEPAYSVKKMIRSGEDDNDAGHLRKMKNILFGKIKSIAQSILIPDAQILWTIPSLATALSVLKEKRIDAIFVSAPPFSSLLFASWLSRISGVPYVADFRDEWTDFYESQFDSHKRIFGNSIGRYMERSVVKHAAAVTMATRSYVENMQRKYPKESNRIHFITNGYDPEDFPANEVSTSAGISSMLGIYYFGTLFNVTTARYFLEACKKFLEKQPECKELLDIHFVGRITEDENAFIDKGGENLRIVRHGYIDHNNVMTMMLNADVLLVIVDELPGAERIIAAKIFEYAYSRRFVLALVPQGGEIDRFVRETDCGISCSPRDPDAIEKALSLIVEKWKDGLLNGVRRGNSGTVSLYSRETLAARLSGILKFASERPRI